MRKTRFHQLYAIALLLSSFLIGPVEAFGQRDGLAVRIDDPGTYFKDSRSRWMGKVIFFLRCEHVKIKNPYFDWYFDPFNPDQSKPDRDELLYKYGKIEEVWHGQFRIHRGGDSYWRLGYFWKVRLLHNQDIIYFWDDDVTKNFNFGFLEDIRAARKEIGQTFWSKKINSLYQFDNQDIVQLANLEPVGLDSVAWGEYGSAPIKLILSRRDGRQGYLLYKSMVDFYQDWHLQDPRLKHPAWLMKDWNLIADRQLRRGMTADMVLLSWGDPSKVRHEGDKDQNQTQLWIYPGVRETTYFLRFVDSRLEKVYWRN